MRFLFSLFALAILAPSAQAYLDYAPNFNLEEEVKAHPYRLLPHGEHYTFAIDADFFKPVFASSDTVDYYKYDFYHGNGYWMTVRSEFKANPDLVLNLAFDITHGTSSNGPTYLALIIPRVGITYRFHHFLGLDWETRLSDIGRQTIGNGLFIEQKETDGGYITAKGDDFNAKLMIDGTGSYRLDGGVIVLDTSLWNGLIGMTNFLQETETATEAPGYMGTLYSRKRWNDQFGYGVELGGDNVAGAGMVYLEYLHSVNDRFHFSIKPQYRYYGHGILGGLPQHVQHNYVSYNQNDKPFTTLMNIFAYGDRVDTYSALIDAEYIFNDFYRIYAESESIRFDYRNRFTMQTTLFRAGVKFFPFIGRDDEFGLLVGNKYLNSSTTFAEGDSQRTFSPPNLPDFENKPLFLQQLYYMANFSIKL